MMPKPSLMCMVNQYGKKEYECIPDRTLGCRWSACKVSAPESICLAFLKWKGIEK